jgi:6-phosphogluconolactonase/glucosamine-6-phosphate isomerase/deaminase
MWYKDRQECIEDANLSASYKLESLASNFKHRKRNLEQQIREAHEENIIRMKQSELENATERYEVKVASIKQQIAQSDIHTTLIANGVIRIE